MVLETKVQQVSEGDIGEANKAVGVFFVRNGTHFCGPFKGEKQAQICLDDCKIRREIATPYPRQSDRISGPVPQISCRVCSLGELPSIDEAKRITFPFYRWKEKEGHFVEEPGAKVVASSAYLPHAKTAG